MRPTPVLRRVVKSPVIQLKNASFYRTPPSSPDAIALFPQTNLELSSDVKSKESWAVVGASAAVRTDFLNALRGQFICDPPNARTYPYLATEKVAERDPRLRLPHHAIQYVGFDADRGQSSLRGSYLSQRYESKREIEDYTVRDFLLGKTALNADEDLLHMPSEHALETVVVDLRLGKLLDMPVSNLSNGQTRRSKIAKALLMRPEVLMLDSPFMGLDPNTVEHLSKVLKNVSEEQSPRIILSLRSNEHVPNWLTRFILLTEDSQIHHIGAHSRMKTKLKTIVKQLDGTHVVSNDAPDPHKETHAVRRKAGRPRKVTQSVTDIQIRLSEDSRELLKGLEASHSKQYSHDYQRVNRLLGNRVGGAAWTKESPDGFPSLDENSILEGESLIEMKGVRVSYGDKTVLGNWEHGDNLKEPGLWWNVKRGERWGVFGPNGSGKTTLTALISSDHPQSYSLPIEFFGTPRLPEPGKRGISFFDIQSRIGFSSPELHAFFPKKISVRQALESAWADTPLGKTNLSPELDDRISAILQWFRAELCPELGMTELQKEELYRPEQCDVRYYRGWTPKPHVRARYEGRRNEIINSNQMQAWADDKPFGSLSFASQRVLLFLRAIVRRPDIVILDEAFSGMDPFTVQKCHTFLAHGDQKTLRLVRVMTNRIAEPFVRRSEIDCFGLSRFPGLSEQQALIIIAHRKEEVPGSVRNWLCLPEPGEGAPRFGIWDGPLQMDPNKWREVWNLPIIKINSLKYQQIHERRVNGRRAAVQRDAEARERKRVELRRQWNKHNKTRDRAHYHLIVLRRLDGEVRRVKLTAEMRKPDFRTRARTTQMLTKAELAYHEGTDMLRHANIWLWARSKMRFHRRKLRQRRIHKVPRSTALMSTRYRSKTEDVGLHGF